VAPSLDGTRSLVQGGKRTYLERVRAPIGLAIGATSPEEIALSILTEIIRKRRTGTTACDAWHAARSHRTVSHQSVITITLEALITA
jgi:xanthine/CO dehydrogenase XdhC/CoxF family maturation factor